MKRIGAPCAAVWMLAMLAACGSKQEPAPTEQTTQPAAQAPATPEVAPAEQAATESEAETPAATVPTEVISETDDAGEETVADNAPSTTQPMLRMGGPATTPATSSNFKEGPNYSRVVPVQPTSVPPGKVEVVEVFWYGCGHCFTLDPAIESWRTKGKPGYVEFLRVPAMWNDTTRMHARLYYTAELLGKLEELHTPIFREINLNGDMLNTVDKITAFFRKHGVNSDEFQKAFSSFSVESKLQRADFLNRRYRIESVPTVIVNGKYKTDVGMAGGEPQLFSLIGELAASEHGG